jgi:hypothetical protein
LRTGRSRRSLRRARRSGATNGLFGRTFVVDEASGRLDFAFSPVLFGAVAEQWNNDGDEIVVNFRLNWIPAPGSDLFLVINQTADSGETFWSPVCTAVVSKLVWRMAF